MMDFFDTIKHAGGRPRLGRVDLGVRVSPEAKDELQQLAAQQGVTGGEFVELLLDHWKATRCVGW